MKRKGFTLVELLAVIAILAILVIIALPNVLKMYNNAKKNSFLTEAKTLAQDVSSKYITESMKGNKITTISNKQNSLDLSGRNIEYNFDLDSNGKIKRMMVYDGTYCVVTTGDYTNLKTTDVSEKCSRSVLYKLAGTLSKDFYEIPGDAYAGLVNSITFYSDGRTVENAEQCNAEKYCDVSEAQDKSIKMYIRQNSNNLYDISIVADGIIAFPKDSSNLFFSHANLKHIIFNDAIDTSKVTNMNYMFGYGDIETLNVSSFDTSNVTDMGGMFHAVKAPILDLSNFDTSKVTNMGEMFKHCTAQTIILSSFDTSKVTSMYAMFNNTATSALDLSNFDTSNVTDMAAMFFVNHAKKITGLNKFDTSKVTDMSEMFSKSEAESLDLSSFVTTNVTNMRSMFYRSNATEITGLNKFNTSKVTSMRAMFAECQAKALDLSSFDTSKVTDMDYMFSSAKTTTGYARTQADADKFNASSEKPSTLTFTVK